MNLMPEKKTNRNLTEKQQSFLDNLVTTEGDFKKAAELAGYSGNHYQVLKSLKEPVKFDKILLPISKKLITPDQRKHITFDAFFSNTMFHEEAHGLGIKNTIDGKTLYNNLWKNSHEAAYKDSKNFKLSCV